MNALHQEAFELQLQLEDGTAPDTTRRGRLEEHLASCPECRGNLQVYRVLQAGSSLQYLDQSIPGLDRVSILQQSRRGERTASSGLPLRAIALVGMALLAVFLAQWVIQSIKPAPGTLPGSVKLSPAQASPTAAENPAGATVLEPLLQGIPSGEVEPSPDGVYFFVQLLEPAPPGGDRRTTSLHFISSGTGEDCPASETFLGAQGYQNTAWLDNRRLLFIDNQGQALVFTACQSGSENLSERFGEPLVRVARQAIPPGSPPPGILLVQGAASYWVFDIEKGEARLLTSLVPATDSSDTFAYRPGIAQAAVIQAPDPLQPARLSLLNLESGEVSDSLEIDASHDQGQTYAEWLGPDMLFIWAMDPAGPLAVDFSQETLQLMRVLPEWMGLEITYPDELASMGAFTTPGGESFHIVVHLNKAQDKSIHVYHRETGQVEQILSSQPVMMILPGDQRIPLVSLADEPVFEEGYQVLWVDDPSREPVFISLAYHLPRTYPNLQTRLLAGGERLLAGSSQGVSLVNIFTGETLGFWKLAGAGDAYLPGITAAPDGRSAIVVSQAGEGYEAVYWLPLPGQGE